MKSAHKLAAALAVLVLLLATGYFMLMALRAGQAQSKPPQADEQAQPGPASTLPVERSQAVVEAAAARTSSEPPPLANQAELPTAQPAAELARVELKEPGMVVEVIQPLEPAPSSGESPAAAAVLPQSTPTSTSTPTPVLSGAPVSASGETLESSSTTVAPSTTSSSAPPLPPPPPPPSNSTEPHEPAEVGAQAAADAQLAPEEEAAWGEFKRQFNRQYGEPQEERRRASIFAGNLRFIGAHNRLPGVLFQLGVNKFADMTRDEINGLMIGPSINWTQALRGQATIPPPMRILAEESQADADSLRSVDWRHLTTGAPPDQGACKESAVFAVVASLEASLNAVGGGGGGGGGANNNNNNNSNNNSSNNNKVKLSEIQLLDCWAFNGPQPPSWPPVCAGHLTMSLLLDFLQRQAIRLATQQDYDSFRAAQAQGLAPARTCMPGGPAEAARPKVGSFGQVHRDNIDEALLNRGPLVVALDASQSSFHFYRSGLYHELQCSSDTFNLHALLVALTADAATSTSTSTSMSTSTSIATATATATQESDVGQAHYTVRASFGPHWGEAGHMRLLKDGARNRCLPQQLATYPNLAYE